MLAITPSHTHLGTEVAAIRLSSGEALLGVTQRSRQRLALGILPPPPHAELTSVKLCAGAWLRTVGDRELVS